MKRKSLFLALGANLCLSLFITACGSSASSSTAATAAAAESAETESSDTAAAESGGAPGDAQGAPGDAPSGEKPEGNPPDGQGGGQPGGGGGANTMTYDYTGDLSGTLTADGEEVTSDGETAESTRADVNTALAQNGGTLTIRNGTLTKSGDDTNGDSCNFYGLNSIVLSVGSDSKAVISDSSLRADSEGSNAIFATDSGTVYAYKDTIHTTAGNSRGLDATYGGTVIADSMDITTEGDHCAALATDRGGGNISATNSTLSTAGSGSPLLYSTGDIEVRNVTGTASGSQIAGMEGYNTILIENSNLTSTITSKTASDPVANGVIIYQSTSGDAESSTGETATFQAVDSQLTSSIEEGSMFYVTNTTANIYLKNTGVNFDSDKAALLSIEGNSYELVLPGTYNPYGDFLVPFGGDSEDEVIRRMRTTLTDIMERPGHESVLAVSHGACTRAFVSSCDATSTLHVPNRVAPNCSVHVFWYENGVFDLRERFVPQQS